MKRTEKSKANRRQKSIANGRQGESKDCDRDKAKYEENLSTEESCSQPLPKHPRICKEYISNYRKSLQKWLRKLHELHQDQ